MILPLVVVVVIHPYLGSGKTSLTSSRGNEVFQRVQTKGKGGLDKQVLGCMPRGSQWLEAVRFQSDVWISKNKGEYNIKILAGITLLGGSQHCSEGRALSYLMLVHLGLGSLRHLNRSSVIQDRPVIERWLTIVTLRIFGLLVLVKFTPSKFTSKSSRYFFEQLMESVAEDLAGCRAVKKWERSADSSLLSYRLFSTSRTKR